MQTTMITIKGLEKRFRVHKRENAGLSAALKSLLKREYRTVEALKGIDLTVEQGEIRGLIGPNGAGKSTLIKILSGILYPTQGFVEVMGFIPWIEREQYVREIGVLFGQRTQLWWDLPAIDTFSLNQKLYQIPGPVYERNLNFFIELLNIGEVVTKPVRQLSLGERMKCEFVAALLHEPKLVFLDEPSIGLDIVAKETIRHFIKEVNREKQTTFILTTHDVIDLEDLCDKVTIINRGEKVYDGSIGHLCAYFENKKRVTLRLTRPVDIASLSNFHVITAKPMSVEIELDLTEKELKREIYTLLDHLPVHDINIDSIHIEQVIKEIYSS